MLVVTEVLQINRIVATSTQEKIDSQQTKMKDVQQWVFIAKCKPIIVLVVDIRVCFQETIINIFMKKMSRVKLGN